MSIKATLLALAAAVMADLCPGEKTTTSVQNGVTRLTCKSLQASHSVNHRQDRAGDTLRMVWSGEALKTMGGIDKPLAMARLAVAIRDRLPDGWGVNYSNAPQGNQQGYPTFWVNRAIPVDNDTPEQVDWPALAAKAKAAGMTREEFTQMRGDVTALRAEIAVRAAWGGSETPTTPTVDSDGDEVSSSAPSGVDDDIPF